MVKTEDFHSSDRGPTPRAVTIGFVRAKLLTLWFAGLYLGKSITRSNGKPAFMAPSSSGLGRLPLKQETEDHDL